MVFKMIHLTSNDLFLSQILPTKSSDLTLIREFSGPSPSVISGKKIQSTETYTNFLNAALRIFSAKHAAFWIFPPGFTDKG